MADKKNKKRKFTSSHESQNSTKISRKFTAKPDKQEEDEEKRVEEDAKMEVEIQNPVNITENGQWRNLDLVLFIRNKKITAHQKVDLIFNFARSKADKDGNNAEEEFNTLSDSRLMKDIGDWIQSLLVTSEKKLRARDEKSELSQLCLDYRCWEILKFCLEESSRLQVPLDLLHDLLRVVSCVSRSAMQLFIPVHKSEESTSVTADFNFHKTVNECLRLLFSSRGGLPKGNLDLWMVAVCPVLDLVIKTFEDKLRDSDMENLIIEFSCLVLEPFSKFLRLHPCRKTGFRDFVEKLLEPLLHLLGMLHEQLLESQFATLPLLNKFAEEILSYGLFHSVHLDEYLTLNSTDKYSSSADRRVKNTRTMVKSYHRHLFDKLENLVSQRKVHALCGIGQMFHLFVNSVKKLKRNSHDPEGLKANGSQSTKDLPKIDNMTSEKSNVTSRPGCNIGRSIFDFFVLMMEPLLLDLTKSLDSDFQYGTLLIDAYTALKSVNRILSTMVRERIYVRMEDNSGGACFNFLKLIYSLFLSCYAKVCQLWKSKWGKDGSVQLVHIHSVAKEFVLIVRNFLDIEYEVISEDLVAVWRMIITFLAISHSSEVVSEVDPLSSLTIDLGCRVLDLYSELRQVDHAVFALCRGLRQLLFYQGGDEMKSSEVLPSTLTLDDKLAKSAHLLVCSQKVRLAISSAIKSIPEGQASGYVQTLSVDVSESLEWIKLAYSMTNGCEFGDAISSHRFSIQAEILGMVLTEIYSLALESLSVNTGNSYRMGVSLQNLMGVLRPCMSLLVAPEKGGIDKFMYTLSGITSQSQMEGCKNDLQDKVPLLILFFVRLYASFRSLYRQALSLMPPNSSKKMSEMMADLYTAYSGDDFLEMIDFGDAGYFCWVVQPSSSLLDIMLNLKDNVLREGSPYNSCLIYVMHVMALQRLVDSNKRIQSAEYIVQRSENIITSKLMDDADLSTLRKSKRKLEKELSCLKEEAASLTGFMMEYVAMQDDELLLTSILNGRTPESSAPQDVRFQSWDLGVCTVNEKTLNTAVWWIVCQNIDIWCNYATKKKLKLFLSLLICNSLPNERYGKSQEDFQTCGGEGMNITRCQISQEVLCDTNFYDQRFVRRYMVSRICNVLKKFVPLLFKEFKSIDVDLSSCDWTEALNALMNITMSAKDKPVNSNCTYSDLVEECCSNKPSAFPNLHVASCRSLLNLLGQMVGRSLTSKSFSLCVIHLVNFERLIINSVVNPPGTLCLHEYHELLGLLLSCRRALKYMVMAFCDKSEVYETLSLPTLSDCRFPICWLFKSLHLLVAWSNTLSSEDNGGRINDMIISLMDHTSYVFFSLSKHQFCLAIHSILSPKEITSSGLDSEGSLLIESSSRDVKVHRSLAMIANTLEDEMKSFFPTLREALSSEGIEISIPAANLNQLLSLVSCIQGFLWGCLCASNDADTSYGDLRAKLKKSKHETIPRIIEFIDTCLQFIDVSSQIFRHNDLPVKRSCDDQGHVNFNSYKNLQGKDTFLREPLNTGNKYKFENQVGQPQSEKPMASIDVPNDSDFGGRKKGLHSVKGHSIIGGVVGYASFNSNCLRTDLLESCLKGQNLELSFFLRRILISSSAIVRLSMLLRCSPMPSNVVQIMLGCSEVLLTKFSQLLGMPNSPSFVWLDGAIIFLEALGSQFPLTSPDKTNDIYAKLVELHMKAIGKCISLQGKGATLASHDIESCTKVLTERKSLDLAVSVPLYGLCDLKSRLRMSFKVLIEKPSELHLLSVIQALEQALVGIQVGFATVYDVTMDGTDGGLVSSVVAAGVDCLDSLLEFLKGNKLLNVVKSHLNGLVASLFNIMVHLQGPTIFYGRPNSILVNKSPDSGSVVLMCVEVLTRIAGKPSLFHLDSHHVAQSLHIPATLFQGFHNLKEGKASHQNLLRSTETTESEYVECCYLADRQFSVNLYAASCRLLWTTVKHHRSGCVRSICLLQTSLQALLYCLEPVSNNSADRKGFFTWEVEEGVKCASYLRRIYEEIRQQREVFGQHCYMFLSDYIWFVSGYGPLKCGVKRDVDEALRPGVHALIDVCSPDDLQYLHTVFGEGPCRGTLANLKHDYERNFKYGGKV